MKLDKLMIVNQIYIFKVCINNYDNDIIYSKVSNYAYLKMFRVHGH